MTVSGDLTNMEKVYISRFIKNEKYNSGITIYGE